ncbi:MAG: hypothetical protein H7Z12_15225 [Rhodospirillaceae bacterium]|nr:hypothetical protein [Rhodospirillales bacterium]
MAEVTFTPPPNHRTSESCATCAQWDSGNDYCRKFPASIRYTGGYRDIYDTGWSGMICDTWEPRLTEGAAE